MRKPFAAALTAAAVVVGAASAGAATVALFTDIGGHEHEQAIRAASAKGLFAGYDDGTFRPDRKLTNRQSEVVLRRLLDRYQDDDGDSTLTRAQAAAVLAYGVCGLDGDCGTITAPRTPTTTAPAIPADTGKWKRNVYSGGTVVYTLSSDGNWDGHEWDFAFINLACWLGERPEIVVSVSSLAAADSLPVHYWSGDGETTSAFWDVQTKASDRSWLAQPASLSRGAFLRNIIDNPGTFVFGYVDAGITTAHHWFNTAGLAAVTGYLYKVCGM